MLTTPLQGLTTRCARSAVLAVPATAVAGNLLAYVLLLAGARALDHDAFGELVSLLGVLLVGTVPAIAVQTVAARRRAAGDTAGVLVTVAGLALACGGVLAALAEPLTTFLHLSGALGPVLVAAAVVPTTCFGPLLGFAQGAARFGRFAALTAIQQAGRSGGGLLGLAVGRSATAAVAGVAVGSLVAVAVGLTLSRPDVHRTVDHGLGLLREILHAGHGHGSVLLLSSLDLLLARHVLASGAAAQYAAGSIITRAALWLPQTVGTLVFSRLASHQHHRRTVREALALIAAIGAAVVLGTALAGGLVVGAVGGGYHGLVHTGWIYAATGSFLALVQFAVLAALAVRRSGLTAVVWMTMLAEVLVVAPLDRDTSATTVASLVAVVVAVGAAVIIVVTLRRPAPRPVTPLDPVTAEVSP
ncbi:hypothetical protein [uncultured Jatrophihabitans sp.]|uniref:hypothetical protein n=1 Tax=uncultured Jatrophihabitans sp. TaxID=1610747 RepID=UPI0035CA8F27